MKAIARYWPTEYLFLLTHGDWSVPALSALLSQHLGVPGMGCSGLAYEHASDLMKLRWRIARCERALPRGRFLFDALVSNEQYLPLQLADSPGLRALICIHKPAATLLSMVKSGVVGSLHEAERVYRDRLEWLAAAGPNLGERALVFPAEMLVEDTNTLLAAIALHLGQEHAIKPVPQDLLDEEQIGESHGSQDRCGELDPGMRERCEEAYHETLLELSRTCLSIGIVVAVAALHRPRPRLETTCPTRHNQGLSQTV